MKKTIKPTTILLALTCLLSTMNFAQSSKKNVNKKNIQSTELENKRWKLTELNGKTVIGDEKSYYVLFHSKTKTLEAKVGCNQLINNYTITSKEVIKIKPSSSTKMFCSGQNIENEFIEALSNTNVFLINNNKLTFKKSRKAVLARFTLVKSTLEKPSQDKFCKELEKIAISNKLDSSRTNLESLNNLYFSCISGELNVNMVHNESELKKYIQDELQKGRNNNNLQSFTGLEYLENETLERIKGAVNFKNENLIIITGLLDAPPFGTIECNMKNNKAKFNLKKEDNNTGVSGSSLMMIWDLYKVKKEIELEK